MVDLRELRSGLCASKDSYPGPGPLALVSSSRSSELCQFLRLLVSLAVAVADCRQPGNTSLSETGSIRSKVMPLCLEKSDETYVDKLRISELGKLVSRSGQPVSKLIVSQRDLAC